MYNANLGHSVGDPGVAAAGEQDSTFKILHAGLKAHLAT